MKVTGRPTDARSGLPSHTKFRTGSGLRVLGVRRRDSPDVEKPRVSPRLRLRSTPAPGLGPAPNEPFPDVPRRPPGSPLPFRSAGPGGRFPPLSRRPGPARSPPPTRPVSMFMICSQNRPAFPRKSPHRAIIARNDKSAPTEANSRTTLRDTPNMRPSRGSSTGYPQNVRVMFLCQASPFPGSVSV